MSCNYDMDFLGIPNVDLSKWKTKYGNDTRLKNIEEIVQDTNLIVKKILSKLEDQEENCEEDHKISFDDDFGPDFAYEYDFEFDK